MDKALVEKAAMQLPPADRALLADALLASLDEEETRKIEAAWAQVAEDRLEAFLRGEQSAMDGPLFLEKLRSQLAQ